MKKIYEDDRRYSCRRPIVDAYIRGSFKKIRYDGLENIPKDGSVILAPNHCDALMDPLAVLAMNRDKKVFVYIMREDSRIGLPSETYFSVCAEGFRRFGFDTAALVEALAFSGEALANERV